MIYVLELDDDVYVCIPELSYVILRLFTLVTVVKVLN